jgi:hypothetical protein
MTKPVYEVLGNGYIKRTEADGKEWFIPMNEDNSDYQRYLNPEAEQSTPIVIDEAKAK